MKKFLAILALVAVAAGSADAQVSKKLSKKLGQILYGEDPNAPVFQPVQVESQEYVAGTDILFQDNLDGEVYGEKPSKWNVVQGDCKIVTAGGKKCLDLPAHGTHFDAGTSAIEPMMEEGLPEEFSIEFDFYMYAQNFDSNNEFWVSLRDGEEEVFNFNHATGAINGRCSYECNYLSEDKQSFTGFYPVKSDDWNKFALSLRGGTILVYVNGAKVATVQNVKAPKSFRLISEQRYVGNDRFNLRGTQFKDIVIAK